MESTALAPPRVEESYPVGEGDLLAVQVYGHADLSGEFKVGSDGFLSYPLIGAFRVKGLSVQQVAAKLEAALERDYLVDAQVSVVVKEFQSQMVIVLGEVMRPGRYYLRSQTTSLMDLISEAGGLTPNVGTLVTLQHPDNREHASAATQVIRLADLMAGTIAEGSQRVGPGDVVHVAKKQFFYLSGEVEKPGSYQIDADLTLLKAISLAGGLGKFASRRVEVHRTVAGKKQVIKVSLGEIENKKVDDVVIEPDDLVIVSRRFL